MPAVKTSRPDKIDLEAGWKDIKAGIDEFLDFLEGNREEPASAETNVGLYTMVYSMCTQVCQASQSNGDMQSRASIDGRLACLALTKCRSVCPLP